MHREGKHEKDLTNGIYTDSAGSRQYSCLDSTHQAELSGDNAVGTCLCCVELRGHVASSSYSVSGHGLAAGISAVVLTRRRAVVGQWLSGLTPLSHSYIARCAAGAERKGSALLVAGRAVVERQVLADD